MCRPPINPEAAFAEYSSCLLTEGLATPRTLTGNGQAAIVRGVARHTDVSSSSLPSSQGGGLWLRAEFLHGLLSLPGNEHVEIRILRAAKESKLRLPWR